MPDLKIIVQNALRGVVAIPAFNVPYLPMVEPVVRAVVDQDSFALIETARLEWYKFEAGSPGTVAKEFNRWLDLEHLQNLAQATCRPLVLHGGSGFLKEYVLASFKKGIAKVNIGTEIRQADESGLRSTGKISAAQDAVYEHTGWLLSEYFGLAGLQPMLTQEVL